LRIEQPTAAEWVVEWSDTNQPLGDKWRPHSSTEVPVGQGLRLVAVDGSTPPQPLVLGPALVTVAVWTPETVEFGIGEHDVRIIVRIPAGTEPVRASRGRPAVSAPKWPAGAPAAMVLLEAEVDTDYGQFELIFDGGDGFGGDFDVVFQGQVNGLVGAASPMGLYFNLGRRSGGSWIRIELLDEAPGEADEMWEDVVEVSSLVPPGDSPQWSTWAGESGGPLALLPGAYRFRVCARGRDEGAADEFAESILAFYLIQLWPSAHLPDEVLRIGSDNARYWHSQVGGRR